MTYVLALYRDNMEMFTGMLSLHVNISDDGSVTAVPVSWSGPDQTYVLALYRANMEMFDGMLGLHVNMSYDGSVTT